MVLAQAAEATHVIDAKLVGALLGIIMVGFIPLVKWLGGMAVASAFEKITGVKADVTELTTQYEVQRGRQDEHGKKLAVAADRAEHAYNKAYQANDKVDRLQIRAAELQKDVDSADEKAEKAYQKAVEVEGGQTELALQTGKLEDRVGRAEEDVLAVRKKSHELSDKVNEVVLVASLRKKT